jgi:hypothetical protein
LNNIGYGEPPLVIVEGFSDFVAFEDGDFGGHKKDENY